MTTKNITWQILILLTVLMAVTTGVHAQQDQSGNIERLTKTMMLEEMLLATQEQNSRAIVGQFDDLINELKKDGLPDDLAPTLKQKMEEAVVRIVNSWDPKEAAHIYTTGIFGTLSNQEIDAAVRHYENPERMRIHQTIMSSQQKALEYASKKEMAQMKVEMKRLRDWIKLEASNRRQRVQK